MRPTTAPPLLLAALLAALTACGPRVAVRPAPPAPEPLLLCNTNVDKWRGNLDLRLPGDGPVFAEAASYAGKVSLHGKTYWLGRGYLVAHLEGQGVTVDAEVDVTEDAVLRTWRRFELGDYGLAKKWAPVHLVDAAKGRLTVRPISWAVEDLEALAPLEFDLACTDTTYGRRRNRGYDPVRDLEEFGLPGDAPKRRVPAGVEAALHASPGGPVRLRLKAGEHPHYVRLLEEKDGWSRIVKTHWVGFAWLGWTPSENLETYEPGGGGLLGALAGGKDQPLRRRCAEPLPLSARVGDDLRTVSEVAAGTLFRVLGEDPSGRVQIRLVGGWLRARDEGRLLLPTKAAQCEALPKEERRSNGLDALLSPPESP